MLTEHHITLFEFRGASFSPLSIEHAISRFISLIDISTFRTSLTRLFPRIAYATFAHAFYSPPATECFGSKA
jgi:hypothetical protein